MNAATRWREIYLLKNKSDVIALLKLFNQVVLVTSGSRIPRLLKDKGREYTSNDFEGYYLHTGTMHSSPPPRHRDRRVCRSAKESHGQGWWGAPLPTQAYSSSRGAS